MLILIIVLLLLFGVGGGWYGNGRWYNNTSVQPGVSPGFNPMGIIWILLIIILIIWLVEETGLLTRLRL